MGNADKVHFNGVTSVISSLGQDPPRYLMYFVHVVVAVKKHCAKLSEAEYQFVVKHLYKMHYSCSKDEYDERERLALVILSRLSKLQDFLNIFKRSGSTPTFP